MSIYTTSRLLVTSLICTRNFLGRVTNADGIPSYHLNTVMFVKFALNNNKTATISRVHFTRSKLRYVLLDNSQCFGYISRKIWHVYRHLWRGSRTTMRGSECVLQNA